MPCLDEQTVVSFVTGALKGAALAEVERHLIGCASCAALVAIAAPDAPGRRTSIGFRGIAPDPGDGPPHDEAPTDDPTATETPRAGGTVGRYRLVKLVGRGGIGEVWAAHDPELDRKVAIKILRADVFPADTGRGAVDAARLVREAQAVAKLSHPNVVTIYDVGNVARGTARVFLAMELVEGETLAAWLDRKRQTREEILRVFALAGRGLAAAHRAGIVHRDFKPQNVMITTDAGVRVMDFGLASREVTTNEPRLTRAGSILGTPLYMSPEQLRGLPVDARADQFGFCIALYEALYRERPFDASSFEELRKAVLNGQLRPVPLGATVPARLRAVLLRGLSVDPGQRFPNMEALLDAIDTAARPRPRFGAVAAVVGAAAVLAIAGVGGWRLWSRRPASTCATPPARLTSAWPTAADAPKRAAMRAAFRASAVSDADARFEHASRNLDQYASRWAVQSRASCEATNVRGEQPPEIFSLRGRCLDDRATDLAALGEVFEHADAKVVRKAVAATLSLTPVEDCADVAALKTLPPPPADPALRSRVDDVHTRLIALRAQAEAGRDWQALQSIGMLTEEARATGFDPLIVETLLVDGRIRSPFDPDAAIPLYEEAFRRAEGIRADRFTAEAAIQLMAIVGGFRHHFDPAQRWSRVGTAALDRLAEHGDAAPRLRGWLLNNRGALQAASGQWRLAAADFATSVTLREQALGPQHPALAASLVNAARAALALDDPARALEAATRAITVASATAPAESYEVGSARLVRGEALLALDRSQEARPDLDAALDTFERVLGRDHPFLADPMTALGEVALATHRPADAQAMLERAWEMRSTHLADAGVREETAFALARAVWDAAPGDRPHALELATEARDGYAAFPDLAPKLAVVDRWIEAHRATRGTRDARPHHAELSASGE